MNLRRLARRLRLFVGPYRELRRPEFDVSADLEHRIAEARAALPANSIKPLRPVLIESQPDAFIKPSHIDELPILPIG